MDMANVTAGLFVGMVVGVTGVGGGALMTPILILLLGYAPHTAIGTDLIFAALTKLAGCAVHNVRGSIDWQVFRRLGSGSIPAALVTVLYLRNHHSPLHKQGSISTLIGIVIILTAAGLISKPMLQRAALTWRWGSAEGFLKYQLVSTVAAGAIIGILVSLTSIGAGALGAAVLVYLYPLRMKPAKLVGTDLAHAIPLALVAGAGHLFIGDVDFHLLQNLLFGSIPGIITGSLIATALPDQLVRNTLGVMLLLVGVKMILA